MPRPPRLPVPPKGRFESVESVSTPLRPGSSFPSTDYVPATVDATANTVAFDGGFCVDPHSLYRDGSVPSEVGTSCAADAAGSSRRSIHFRDLTVHSCTLGRGRFGVVKLATLGTEEFALKTVDCSREACASTVRNECRQLLARPGEYSVRTLQAYYSRTQSTVSFLMEYMHHGDLKQCADRLAGAGLRFGAGDVAVVAASVARALGALRRWHIIHRDVKPGNVLVNRQGEVKLADFGISCLTDHNSEAKSHCGTFSWMAPERVRSPEGGYSYRSDVYSLGLVVAWLQLGAHPRPAQDPLEFVMSVDSFPDGITLPDHPTAAWGAGLGDADALNFVFVCTRRDPAARPTAAQLVKHPLAVRALPVLPVLPVLPQPQRPGAPRSPSARGCPAQCLRGGRASPTPPPRPPAPTVPATPSVQTFVYTPISCRVLEPDSLPPPAAPAPPAAPPSPAPTGPRVGDAESPQRQSRPAPAAGRAASGLQGKPAPEPLLPLTAPREGAASDFDEGTHSPGVASSGRFVALQRFAASRLRLALCALLAALGALAVSLCSPAAAEEHHRRVGGGGEGAEADGEGPLVSGWLSPGEGQGQQLAGVGLGAAAALLAVLAGIMLCRRAARSEAVGQAAAPDAQAAAASGRRSATPSPPPTGPPSPAPKGAAPCPGVQPHSPARGDHDV